MRPSSSPSEGRGPGDGTARKAAAGSGSAASSDRVDASDPFDAVFGDPEVDAACGASAWLDAMLDAERELAAVQAEAGLIPAAAARAVAAAGRGGHVTTAVFAAASSASPVVPLVRALCAAVPADAEGWVHHGATSQDIMDTALMLVAKRCTALISEHLDTAAAATAVLVAEHRDSLMIGRTLGRHAAPTTFGALAAGWLSGLDAAREQLGQVREELAAQLGGPVGTLEAYGDKGLRLLTDYAERLGLADPGLPWHTERSRVARLASVLATAAGTAAKIARDVTVLGSGDAGELHEDGGEPAAGPSRHEPGGPSPASSRMAAGSAAPRSADNPLRTADDRLDLGGANARWYARGNDDPLAAPDTHPASGGSSAMPHKRNPAGSLLVLANARAAPGHVTTLLAALESELQRPAGAWQSEWQALTQLLRRTGGATASLARLLAGLDVGTERMRSNLDGTGGLLRSGAIADRLAPALGRAAAHRLIAGIAARAATGRDGEARLGSGDADPTGAEATAASHRPAMARPGRNRFRELLAADPVVAAHLSPTDLSDLCDPAACLPAARAIADRALARHRAPEEP